MTLDQVAELLALNLTFNTDTPMEESFYLVAGKLECPNGCVCPHFIVCGSSCGKWYVAPEGEWLDKGLPMWDGGLSSHGDGTTRAPFTPIKWAKLPQGEE